MEKHKWIVSLDWLTLNYHSIYQLSAESFQSAASSKFYVEKMPYSTRHFENIFLLYHTENYQRHECLQVVFSPYSKVLHPCLIQVKISNMYLYNGKGYQVLRDLEKCIQVDYQGISRIDICIDSDYQAIKELTNGLKDRTLMMRGKKKVQEYYTIDKHKGVEYEGVKFGSVTSAYTFKIYNKTKEIYEESMKYYILDWWRINGFANDAIMWRYEFSIIDFELKCYASGEIIDGRKLLTDIDKLFEILSYYQKKIACVRIEKDAIECSVKKYIRFDREIPYYIIPPIENIDKPIRTKSMDIGQKTQTAKISIGMMLGHILSGELSKYEVYMQLQSIYTIANRMHLNEWLIEKKADEIKDVYQLYDLVGIKCGDIFFQDLFKEHFEIRNLIHSASRKPHIEET